jgi:hypothetical protein
VPTTGAAIEPPRHANASRGKRRRLEALTRSVAFTGGGETYALNWRSDPRLLAILARTVQRELKARLDRASQSSRRARKPTPAVRTGRRPIAH